MLLGTTGILAINIGGTTIHSGLGIKPGTKVLGLNDKSKATFRNRLSEVIYGQILIQFWGGGIFLIRKKAFAGLSVMTVV